MSKADDELTAFYGEGARQEKVFAAARARAVPRPRIVCLCGSSRFYAEFQQANYDQTMRGEIVLSIGFYPRGPSRSSETAHAVAQAGHGEGVGHDSEQKTMLDELHKRKIDLADYCLIVSDAAGYYGASTTGEIAYSLEHGKPVEFTEPAARWRFERQAGAGLLPAGAFACPDCGVASAHPDDAAHAYCGRCHTFPEDRAGSPALTASLPARPANSAHVPAPDETDALTMAGVLLHFTGGSSELRGRLARWIEHHPGDLNESIIAWYLGECHALLEPGCGLPLDGDMHPGRAR